MSDIQHATRWLDEMRPTPAKKDGAALANMYAQHCGRLETMIETLYGIAMRTQYESDRALAQSLFREAKK